MGLDLNGTHLVLAYADDVNSIGDDIRIERNADVIKCLYGYWLAANTGKTMYVEIGYHWRLFTNEHITVGSNSYEKLKTYNI